jgi:aerobic carbon-monoxide dehydrogenase large subunit
MASASPLLRVEDARLLRGQGGFVANQRLPGMLHAVFVRSPHAHARIASVQPDEARSLPGVVAVFLPADFQGLPAPQVNPLLPGLQVPGVNILHDSVARWVGAPVAMVL